MRNLKQGTVWEVKGDHLERLLASPDYEIAESLDKLTKADLVYVAQVRGVRAQENWLKDEIVQALRR